MRSLFRSFERARLKYLLISGQASVLYGAATFSEDVDIWIEPTVGNARRLLAALAARRALIYKLTPALNRRNLLLGHGFHFVVPSRPLPIYLDVLARPPRVGSLRDASRRAVVMDTGWGRIPVVSTEDLIALKQTRRLSDYEVISNLVRIKVGGQPQAQRSLLLWAARSTFRAEDRVDYLRRIGRTASTDRCRTQIALAVARLQRKDSLYWGSRIADLRRLRRAGKLLPRGMPVASLIES